MRYQDLVNQLIDRRYTLHLSQNRLSERCGVYQPAIHKYEKFKATMQLKTLLAIMDGLRLRLFVEDVCITSGVKLYGVVKHTLVKCRQHPQEMLEALGYSKAAYATWGNDHFNNTQVDRLLEILAYLHLSIKIREEAAANEQG